MSKIRSPCCWTNKRLQGISPSTKVWRNGSSSVLTQYSSTGHCTRNPSGNSCPRWYPKLLRLPLFAWFLCHIGPLPFLYAPASLSYMLTFWVSLACVFTAQSAFGYRDSQSLSHHYQNHPGTMQFMGLHINSLTYVIICVAIGTLVDFLVHTISGCVYAGFSCIDSSCSILAKLTLVTCTHD